MAQGASGFLWISFPLDLRTLSRYPCSVRMRCLSEVARCHVASDRDSLAEPFMVSPTLTYALYPYGLTSYRRRRRITLWVSLISFFGSIAVNGLFFTGSSRHPP